MSKRSDQKPEWCSFLRFTKPENFMWQLLKEISLKEKN